MIMSLNLANSADPDEILPYGAFHLGFHCLLKYLSAGLRYNLNFVKDNISFVVC